VSLSEPVRRWVASVLGPFRVLEARSAALRVETAEGPRWVKVYPTGRAWLQSERAFDVVVPALQRVGIEVPRVLAARRGLRVRVLTEVAGRPATLDDGPDTFRSAARVLAQLHRIPCVQEALPLSTAMRQRVAAWAGRPGAPSVAAAVAAWVDAHASSLDANRAWCHRDFHPRNWLVSDGRLGLVDFEHARPDHRLVDWVRLEAEGWSDAQRAAFVEVLGEPDPVALRAVLAIHGLATRAWAHEHGDAELASVGERALARAGFPLEGSAASGA